MQHNYVRFEESDDNGESLPLTSTALQNVLQTFAVETLQHTLLAELRTQLRQDLREELGVLTTSLSAVTEHFSRSTCYTLSTILRPDLDMLDPGLQLRSSADPGLQPGHRLHAVEDMMDGDEEGEPEDNDQLTGPLSRHGILRTQPLSKRPQTAPPVKVDSPNALTPAAIRPGTAPMGERIIPNQQGDLPGLTTQSNSITNKQNGNGAKRDGRVLQRAHFASPRPRSQSPTPPLTAPPPLPPIPNKLPEVSEDWPDEPGTEVVCTSEQEPLSPQPMQKTCFSSETIGIRRASWSEPPGIPKDASQLESPPSSEPSSHRNSVASKRTDSKQSDPKRSSVFSSSPIRRSFATGSIRTASSETSSSRMRQSVASIATSTSIPWRSGPLEEKEVTRQSSLNDNDESNEEGRESRHARFKTNMTGFSRQISIEKCMTVTGARSTFNLGMGVRNSGNFAGSPSVRSTQPHKETPLRRMLRKTVLNPWFEYTVGALLMLNAISIGLHAQHRAADPSGSVPGIFHTVELGFGVLFTVELLVRIYAFRSHFFTMKGRQWNIFDFIVVSLQDAEIMLDIGMSAGSNSSDDPLKDLSFLRMLRLGRVVRLLRMVRLIPELKSMVYLIAASMASFLWTLVLLILLMYGVAVHLTEVVADYLHDNAASNLDTFHVDKLDDAFGSLFKAVTSLYQSILGGIDWKELMDELNHITWTVPLLFSMYVAFAALVMLNLVTGVFVEGAQRIVSEDRDAELVKHAKKVFSIVDDSDDNEISWSEFVSHLEDPSMAEYFKLLGISRSDAKDLFMLLDLDKSGNISLKEFVNGCLQLRGAAKSLDLARMAYNAELQGKRLKSIEKKLLDIRTATCSPASLDKLSDSTASLPVGPEMRMESLRSTMHRPEGLGIP